MCSEEILKEASSKTTQSTSICLSLKLITMGLMHMHGGLLTNLALANWLNNISLHLQHLYHKKDCFQQQELCKALHTPGNMLLATFVVTLIL